MKIISIKSFENILCSFKNKNPIVLINKSYEKDLQNFKLLFSCKYKNSLIEIFIEYSIYKMDEISWTN